MTPLPEKSEFSGKAVAVQVAVVTEISGSGSGPGADAGSPHPTRVVSGANSGKRIRGQIKVPPLG